MNANDLYFFLLEVKDFIQTLINLCDVTFFSKVIAVYIDILKMIVKP